jgi:L-lactate dehydrogenase complex protein LldE
MTVQLFIPCYIDQFSPHVAQSLCNFLDILNISWNYPAAQTCCGQFAFNAGDWPSARRLMRHFFQVFNSSEPIICASASCVLTIRRHYPLLLETTTDATNLRRLQSQVLEFTEWLAKLLPLPFPLTWAGKIFLHNSCSAKQLNILPSLKHFLGLIQDLQLTEASHDYTCCGFGGLFSFKCSDLALAIGSAYLQAVLDSDATALVSADVGCLLHLQKITNMNKISLPMYHLVELICRASQKS